MSRPRAIFFATFPPPFTGQTIGTALTEDLLSEDLDITRINLSRPDLNVGRGYWGQVRRTWDLLVQTAALVRRLRRNRADILYLVLSSSLPGHFRDALFTFAARPYVERIVCHVRSGNFHLRLGTAWHGRLSRGLVERIDAFLFLSRHLEQAVAPFVAADKRFLAPNPIDGPLRFSDQEVARKLEQRKKRSRLRIAFISNFIPSKGYWDLARALKGLAQRSIPFQADFAGLWLDVREEERFHAFMTQSGLRPSIRIHGPIEDREKVKSLLAGTDVLVLPTYYPVEAQPRSLIEALNAATPVVATRHASIPEFVEDGLSGFLVDKRSPRQIEEALAKTADLTTWLPMAEAARRCYLQRFAPEVVKDCLKAAFSLGEEPSR